MWCNTTRNWFANDDPNTVGQYVKVTATLKNTNYDVAASQTSTINGVKVIYTIVEMESNGNQSDF